jgi:hypothetical protein
MVGRDELGHSFRHPDKSTLFRRCQQTVIFPLMKLIGLSFHRISSMKKAIHPS